MIHFEILDIILEMNHRTNNKLKGEFCKGEFCAAFILKRKKDL